MKAHGIGWGGLVSAALWANIHTGRLHIHVSFVEHNNNRRPIARTCSLTAQDGHAANTSATISRKYFRLLVHSFVWFNMKCRCYIVVLLTIPVTSSVQVVDTFLRMKVTLDIDSFINHITGVFTVSCIWVFQR